MDTRLKTISYERKEGFVKSKNKSKKRILEGTVFGLFIFILALLLIQVVSANFVCGQVRDSSDNNSASWYNARVYYSNKANNYSLCQVSPDENKFCCDANNVSGIPFKIGQRIFSEVYDNDTGYVAGPVSLVSTSEGYDVFPIMNLNKVINIYNPDKRLIISNYPNITLNSSFLYPYNNVTIELNKNKIFECSNCTSYFQNLSASYGMNSLKISAGNASRIFFETFSFGILKYAKINRNIICDKCNNNNNNNNNLQVPSNSNLSIRINVTFSDYIDGYDLEEYVPRDFVIINSGGGEVRPYSDTHNVIVWNVSGKSVFENYIIKSPDKKLFNTKYAFKSEIEGINISIDNIIVNGFLPFFSSTEKSSFVSIKKKIFSKVGPNNPIVLNFFSGTILQFGVFPKKQIKNVEFDLKSYKYTGDIENVLEYYIFDTNLKTEDINRMYIKFQIDKRQLKAKGYTNISLLIQNNNSYIKTPIELYRDEKIFAFYNTYSLPGEGFLIVGEK